MITNISPHFQNLKSLNIQQIYVVCPPDPNMIQTLVLEFRSLLALLLTTAIIINNMTTKPAISCPIMNNILKYYYVQQKKYNNKGINIQAMYLQENQTITTRIDMMMSKSENKQTNSDKQYIQSLPAQFIKFLKQKQIPVEQLTVPIPRFIRIKPNTEINLELLIKSLKIKQEEIVKIDQQFYALHPDIKISNCDLYEKGIIYGMDFSSCVPVRCLQAQNGHKVLQLCSAPGNKSMYLADSLKDITITGVEINVNRANIMRNLIKKYHLDNKIQVKVQDGLKFDSEIKYDRVLIDAQCTHQGSIKHIKKFLPKNNQQNNIKSKKNEIKKLKNLSKQQIKQYQVNNSNPYTSQINKTNEWSVEDFKQRFLDEKKLNNLNTLQSGLLENGFRLLKEDGILVYSTCSFDAAQNQDVILDFLIKNKNAVLVDCQEGLKCPVNYTKGRLKQTIRFSPSVSRCGGMFVSKIKKIKISQQKTS